MLNWLPWSNQVAFDEPKIKFGRYSDAHKADAQIELWNKALMSFEAKKYLEAYHYFFQFITDTQQGNVQYQHLGNKITFILQQGSKVIEGFVEENACEAQTVIAKINPQNVVVMRKLLEFNYQLKYSRYSIEEDKIKLSFFTSTIDGSPEKLYYALRELATHADRQDDILIQEFEALEPIPNQFIEPISEKEKEIKFGYIHLWINQAFSLIAQLDSNQNDEIIANILLCTAFKIDYLIVPNGELMNNIEKIQHINFVPDGTSRTEKNNSIFKILKAVLDAPKETIFKELYNTKATFGVTQPATHESISNFISQESPKSSYIKNAQQFHIHVFIQEYLIQHILYYWGIYPPTYELLRLLVRVINDSYFVELGFKPAFYQPIEDKLNKKALLAKIEEIEKKGKERYPKLKIEKENLSFNSIPLFVESVLNTIQTLNYH